MGLFTKVGAPNMLYDFPKFQNLAPKKAFNGISPLNKLLEFPCEGSEFHTLNIGKSKIVWRVIREMIWAILLLQL